MWALHLVEILNSNSLEILFKFFDLLISFTKCIIFFLLSFRCAEVRENTIASLKSAASHGADFVEFDVQLSRDLIPVLYHDFYVAIAMKRKKQISSEEMIQLPVKDLSLEQLQRLKVNFVGFVFFFST